MGVLPHAHTQVHTLAHVSVMMRVRMLIFCVQYLYQSGCRSSAQASHTSCPRVRTCSVCCTLWVGAGCVPRCRAPPPPSGWPACAAGVWNSLPLAFAMGVLMAAVSDLPAHALLRRSRCALPPAPLLSVVCSAAGSPPFIPAAALTALDSQAAAHEEDLSAVPLLEFVSAGRLGL